MNDVKSLSHSKWRCKYHIVFAPKYRRQIIYGQIKEDIGKILRSLCNRKQVELIEAEFAINNPKDNFWDFTIDDFSMINYHPMKPIKFEVEV